MSFIANANALKGKAYEPGYFLAHEECVRVTHQVNANSALVVNAQNGGKYIPMGAIYPENGNNAIGIVYEDVDVTNGDAPASLVIGGRVYTSRVNGGNVVNYAQAALKDIVFVNVPAVNRNNRF